MNKHNPVSPLLTPSCQCVANKLYIQCKSGLDNLKDFFFYISLMEPVDTTL